MDINDVILSLKQKAKLADQYREQYNSLNSLVKGDLLELRFELGPDSAYWRDLPDQMRTDLKSVVRTVAAEHLSALEAYIEFLANSPIIPKPEEVSPS
jgi:hypothetical protein